MRHPIHVYTEEIKDLKEELQKSKTISQIEVSFEEKRLKAQLNAEERDYAQKEQILQVFHVLTLGNPTKLQL